MVYIIAQKLTPMRILLLRHVSPGHPPDACELELAAQGVEVVDVRPEAGEAIPDWRDFDGMLAMGGAVSVYDEERNPWLAGEKATIGEAVRGGLPYWGVCLGGQLLAAGLGAQVSAGARPEIGVKEVELLPAAGGDPIFGRCPATFRTLEWHRDGFELPAGATPLARSAQYPNQAFAWGPAYGVQFHLEPSAELFRHWLAAPRHESAEAEILDEQPELVAEVEEVAPEATALARRLLARWLDLIRAGGLAPPPADDRG
jgi:GMP synthase (glutamine-hydrolysing)